MDVGKGREQDAETMHEQKKWTRHKGETIKLKKTLLQITTLQ